MFVILAQRTGTTNEKDIRPKGQEIRDGGSLSKKLLTAETLRTRRRDVFYLSRSVTGTNKMSSPFRVKDSKIANDIRQ